MTPVRGLARARAWARAAPCALAIALSTAWVIALALLPCGAAHASSTRFCDEPVPLTAEQKDKLFRFGAVIKDELEASGESLAFIARSGLDLGRFGVRYSHAGLSLKTGLSTPWSVRQLYYACDERRPRVFDQGISGFLLGLNDPSIGYVSIVFVPPAQAAAMESAALDNRRALQLLGATYSANAYPFSLAYQNCNPWVAEMLAAAWGGLEGSPDEHAQDLRAQAQAWLKDQGYRPSVFDLGWRPMMWLASFIPWLHNDDHPAEDLGQALFQVSMPASIEAFVQATVPGATRVELCHVGARVVVRRGWELLPEGCVPGPQDTVITLD